MLKDAQRALLVVEGIGLNWSGQHQALGLCRCSLLSGTGTHENCRSRE